jgi:hypothetical protein
VIAGVAAAALICIAVALIAARHDDSSGSDSDSDPSTTTSIVESPWVEQPLVETAVSIAPEVAKPGSAHAFSVAGHPDLLIWTTLTPNPRTGVVEEWQCVSEAGSSGCGSTSEPAQFGQTSSIDNHFASDDLFTWSNLPPDVVAVRYDDGIVRLWQKPIAGLAIFRVDPKNPHPIITALDATGATLPYSFWSQNPQTTPPGETTAHSTVTPATDTDIDLWVELRALTQSSTHDCLTTNGATWPQSNIPSFNADVDPLAIWNLCVLEVTSIVAARQAELTVGG